VIDGPNADPDPHALRGCSRKMTILDWLQPPARAPRFGGANAEQMRWHGPDAARLMLTPAETRRVARGYSNI
jgi:hypothetical protein